MKQKRLIIKKNRALESGFVGVCIYKQVMGQIYKKAILQERLNIHEGTLFHDLLNEMSHICIKTLFYS